MKKILSLVLSFAMLLTAVPMSAVAADEGHISYEVIINPQFEDVGLWSHGLAAVKQGGKWGYMDESGKMVIPAKYDVANFFSEGKAIVATELAEDEEFGDKTFSLGFVDTKGNYTPFMGEMLLYDQKETVPTELTVYEWEIRRQHAETGEYVANKNLRFFNGYFMLGSGEFTYIFGVDGQLVQNPMLDRDYYTKFNEGMAVVGGSDLSTYGSLVIIDTNGNTLATVPTYGAAKYPAGYIFSTMYGFNDGLSGAWVAKVKSSGLYEDADFKFALVNTKGQIAFTGNYDYVYYSGIDYANQMVNDGLVVLRDAASKLWGAVDKTGKVVVPFAYEEMRNFGEGLAPAKKNGKFGYIDNNGKMVIEAKFQTVTPFSGGYAVVVENGQAYCIDRYGKKINGSEKINQKAYFPDGLGADTTLSPGEIILIQEDGKYGFARMTYVPTLPKENEMGIWYYKEAVQAMEQGLVPVYLQNQYFNNITRGDFADLIVATIEETTGKDIWEIVEEKTGKDMLQLVNGNKFVDTSDSNVIAACALGIIAGAKPDRFQPYGNLTREQAAALLMRTANLLSDEKTETTTRFADDSSISAYAKDAVSYVADKKIMSGTGNNEFSPQETYTREQAYVTIFRLFELLK